MELITGMRFLAANGSVTTFYVKPLCERFAGQWTSQGAVRSPCKELAELDGKLAHRGGGQSIFEVSEAKTHDLNYGPVRNADLTAGKSLFNQWADRRQQRYQATNERHIAVAALPSCADGHNAIRKET
ncbi:hypothetical protein IVB14_01310 [Bradyrhizobium sp. 180]|uniref:hypothetical protein n=1 Tax=Bradyrhizobium sp. 180 TaxID=2782650 RepID=UPI001FF92DC1|nr:hypothetical protein [Bradyrhizobium sp. 180]MCK1489114.1 hypothetical protein [Bradyrhizobium sp. 180]